MIMKPRPSLEATSSAEMTQVQDRPRMIFMPDRICGRQPGNSTSRMTCQRLAPRLRAARTSTGSMLREASIT
ncbi:hypothetical protein D3C72_2146140 [compost metagenome]